MLAFACVLYSCRQSGSTNIPVTTADTSHSQISDPELKFEPWTDPFFPRFSISEDDFKRMIENYRAGCNLEEKLCKLQKADQRYDQVRAIEIVHGGVVKIDTGRYGTDGSDEERYIKFRGINTDTEEGKKKGEVSGYSTLLFSITSKNKETFGKTFYYDMVSICPPPFVSCMPIIPGKSGGAEADSSHQ